MWKIQKIIHFSSLIHTLFEHSSLLSLGKLIFAKLIQLNHSMQDLKTYPPYRPGQGGKNWQKKASDHQKSYRKFLAKANKNSILKELPALHQEAFDKIDCLQCANCCKNYSPRFKTPDIKRIARHLKMKEGDFIETYLKLDEDGDYVVRSTPCPFLAETNHCRIYEVRPSDCVRFPYTNEDVIFKRPQLTLKNSSFCPIVFHVLEALTKIES